MIMDDEGIPLVDTRRFKFGTIEWQDAMKHNVIEKITHNEELGPTELCFIEVQVRHDFKQCKNR